MKYKILIILCLTWFYSYVEAQTVSRTDAVAIAKKYMATSQTLVEKTVDSVYCIERNGKNCCLKYVLVMEKWLLYLVTNVVNPYWLVNMNLMLIIRPYWKTIMTFLKV